MKNKKYILIAIILVIVILIGGIFVLNKESAKKSLDDKSTVPSTTLVIPNSDVITDISDFDFHFIKLENNKENIIYSPLSIKYALNMVRDGANGNTLKELDKLLGKSKLNKYKNVKDHISLANAVFVRNRYKDNIRNSYIKEINNKYNAEVKYDKFKNANNINKWIEDSTLGLIKNMIDDSIVENPTTEVILVNALALKLNFKEKFNEAVKDTFYVDNKKQDVKMMSIITDNKDNKYYKDDKITVIRKDLVKEGNYEFEFIAIEPKEDLSKYINSFSKKELDKILKLTKSVNNSEELNIKIPKFSYEYDLKLVPDLISLGVKDMFDINSANLSRLSKKELFVSDALHKALIDVDENGIKAAAVTAIIANDSLGIKDPKERIDITFDNPFMYLIRNKNNGDIWFIGTVYEPDVYNKKFATDN